MWRPSVASRDVVWVAGYPLQEVPLVMLRVTLCNMDDVVEVKLSGEARLAFLRRLLPFERGMPSHDTLNDVMNGIDAEPFMSCSAGWAETLREGRPDIVAIDRKTSRRCHDKAGGAGRSTSYRPGRRAGA